MKTLAAVLIATMTLAGLSAQAQVKKKAVKPGTAKRKVSEAEAKSIHDNQMQQAGRTNERSAYKRAEIESVLHEDPVLPAEPVPSETISVNRPQDENAVASTTSHQPVGNEPTAGKPLAIPEKKRAKLHVVMPGKAVAKNNRPKEPVFLDNVVVERTNW